MVLANNDPVSMENALRRHEPPITSEGCNSGVMISPTPEFKKCIFCTPNNFRVLDQGIDIWQE